MTMNELFLGIDTSNYTTSLCLSDGDGVIVAESKRLLPVAENACGLRQSDALFCHVKALPILAKTLFDTAHGKGYSQSDIAAVGYSARPRDKEGSYMPCFLAGESVAVTLAAALGIDCFDFSHQAGHISAAVHTCGGNVGKTHGKFISFHVSGGTTEILLTEKFGATYSCDIIGGTLDLNAGQAIDRTGVAMELSFPCGREMDSMSQKSERVFSNAELKVSVKDGFINLAGLENMAKKMIENGEPHEDICRFVFSFIAKSLKMACIQARDKVGNLPVCFAGGVMSNTLIRGELCSLGDVFFAKPEYSCDNAYGISLLTRNAYVLKTQGDKQ